MQGKHAFRPQARTVIDLESFVAKDHLLRKVDRVLGLSFGRGLTASCYASGRGRPSIDPEVFFRMLLVAYLYGIAADRRLCEEVHNNLAYRWFCRLSLADDVPDHSSLSRIRDRYGEEVFEALFRHIVTLCQQEGLVVTPISSAWSGANFPPAAPHSSPDLCSNAPPDGKGCDFGQSYPIRPRLPNRQPQDAPGSTFGGLADL